MKLGMLIQLLVLMSISISAQSIVLNGKVTDTKTGEPVQGAVVFISQNHLSYTNNDGNYSISNLKEGSYLLRVSQVGYKTFTETVNVSGVVIKNISLESSPIELDEVLVTTSRFDKYLRNSPYSELMISNTQIESKPYQSLPDALKHEPGISLISEGTWGTEISIRGLSRENVVALVDGNRIATSTDVAARFSLVDISDIERVEIIKGASSSIYGSGATGGIVNIVTRTPRFNDSFMLNGNISTGYNSVNNSSISSGLITGGGSFWTSKISASYRKAGNIQTPSGKLKNSQFEDYSFAGSLNIIPVNNHLIKLNYQLLKAEDVGIPGSAVFPSNADVRYPHERRELISVGYEIQNITPNFYKLSFKYSHQLIERDVENIPNVVQNIPASGTTPARRVSVLGIYPSADHNNNNIQLQGNFLLGDDYNLIVGLDYWDRSYNGNRERHQLIEVLNAEGNVINRTNRIIGESPLPDSKFSSLGLYAQNETEIVKNKFAISLGARVDKIDVSGETTYNPVYEIVNGVRNDKPAGQSIIWNEVEDNDVSYSANVGLKYSVNNNLDLTLSLGYAFRSPSLEERFQYIDQGSYIRLGNPNLNTETGRSADFGIRYYSERFKVISSLFYNYFNDLVIEKPGTFEGRAAFIKTNVGEAKLYGFDFKSDYNFYNNMVLYLTASYVKGDDITAGGHLPNIPPLNGTAGVKFDVYDFLEADISSTIYAEQNKTASNEIRTPGYAVFNLSIISKKINLSSISLRISGGVDNIFDKNYRNHLSTTRGSITTEPGRNFYIKLSTYW